MGFWKEALRSDISHQAIESQDLFGDLGASWRCRWYELVRTEVACCMVCPQSHLLASLESSLVFGCSSLLAPSGTLWSGRNISLCPWYFVWNRNNLWKCLVKCFCLNTTCSTGCTTHSCTCPCIPPCNPPQSFPQPTEYFERENVRLKNEQCGSKPQILCHCPQCIPQHWPYGNPSPGTYKELNTLWKLFYLVALWIIVWWPWPCIILWRPLITLWRPWRPYILLWRSCPWGPGLTLKCKIWGPAVTIWKLLFSGRDMEVCQPSEVSSSVTVLMLIVVVVFVLVRLS